MIKQRMEQRMGRHLYERRRNIEAGRLRAYHRIISPRMSALKVRVIRPILTFGLRLLGLYQQGYSQFHNICVRHNTLSIAGLPAAFEGYTLLQMSDLHIDLDPTLIDSIVSVISDLQYDLCVITGDFRNATIGTFEDVVPPMQRLLEEIEVPVYGVLGNHDFITFVPPLEEAGMRFLVNEAIALERAGVQIHLVGIDDPNIYETHDLNQALRDIPENDVKILLSHSPAIYQEAAERNIQVVLSGHTHGGQICLPGGAIVIRNDKSPRRFLRGVWRHGKTVGYTSVGTGASGIPVRFNCPPEVTLHTLERLQL